MHNRQVTADQTTVPDRLVPRTPWIHRGWVGPVAGLLAFVLVLLPVAVWGLAYVGSSYEADRLITRIEASEAAMIAFDAELNGIAAGLGDPATATQEQVTAAQQAMVDAAARADDEITAAGEAVAEARVAPWQQGLATARDAYVAHNQAWQDYLAAAQADPAQFTAPQQEINDTFVQAERDVRRATAGMILFDLPERVDAIFAPPEQSGSGADAGDSGEGMKV